MQRSARTYAIGAALVLSLTGGLTACSGSADDGAADTKPGDSAAAASEAAPGKYDTLPEPCGAVSTGTLKAVLPGTPGTPSADGAGAGEGGDGAPGEDASASPYKGEPTVTYDTDRRVGCRWKSATSLGTRHLSIDLERVVSYDPAVSDDKQAELLYDERAGQADIPTDGGSATHSASPDSDGAKSEGAKGESTKSDGAKSDGAKPQETGRPGDTARGSAKDGSAKGETRHGSRSGREKSDTASPSPSDSDAASAKAGDGADASKSPSDAGSPSTDADLAPRTLDGIGDNAYIDDELDTADSGVHRDITLVFRSANIVATVKYDQWLTDKHRVPDSAELQKKARRVAQELAAGFDDD